MKVVIVFVPTPLARRDKNQLRQYKPISAPLMPLLGLSSQDSNTLRRHWGQSLTAHDLL